MVGSACSSQALPGSVELLNSSSSIISPFGQMIIRAGMLSQDILPLADVAHAETR
jgi:hypothetical protein